MRSLGYLTVAVVGDHVLVGEATSFGFNGTFSVAAVTAEPMSCTGRFRYRGRSSRGKATYSCDNALSGTLQIEMRDSARGTARGDTAMGPMVALYGYDVDQVNARLTFPGGQRLAWAGEAYRLIP